MAAAAAPASTANTNGTLFAAAVAATYAPIIYIEPCARLITPMIPNTSVKPAASKKSMTPNCKPFSVCSTARVMPGLERAQRRVGVPQVARDLPERADLELPIGRLEDARAVPVFD